MSGIYQLFMCQNHTLSGFNPHILHMHLGKNPIVRNQLASCKIVGHRQMFLNFILFKDSHKIQIISIRNLFQQHIE